MRILELCTSRGMGGLELYALQVVEYLAAHRGYQVLSVVRPGSLLDARIAEHKFYLRPRFKLLPLLAAWRLARLIDAQQIDVIHTHWNKDLLLAVLAKQLARRKVKILFIRHMAITRHKRDFYHRFIYRNVDKYLVITEQLRREAEQFLPIPAERLEVLYHGVARAAQTASAATCQQFKQQHAINAAAFSVLLPGRIEHYKGQHLLLEAIQQLQQQGLQIQVAIMGHVMDQGYFASLQQQVAKAQLNDAIHFLGFVQDPQQYYSCFDVVILTTYAETFGLVLVEAMQAGVAVIGSNAGGVPEIIRQDETGLLFTPGDSQALAAALARLVNDRALRERLAAAGQAYASEQFSRTKHFSRLEVIFQELVAEPKS